MALRFFYGSNIFAGGLIFYILERNLRGSVLDNPTKKNILQVER